MLVGSLLQSAQQAVHMGLQPEDLYLMFILK